MKNNMNLRHRDNILAVASVVAGIKILLCFNYTEESFSSMYLYTIYGNCSPEAGIIEFIIALLIPFAFQIMTAEYIASDLNTAITYILPRAKSLKKYFFCKVRGIFFLSLKTVFISNLYIILFCIFRTGIFSHEIINPLLFSLVLQILLCFTMSLLVNTISIVVSEKWAYLIGIIIMVVQIFITNVFKKNIAISRLNPIYHYFIQWHGQSLIANNITYPIMNYNNDCAPIELSILYFILIIMAEIFVGCMLLKSKDLILRRK